MKDGHVFYSDYSKPEEFCDEAWSTLQMSMMYTKNLPPTLFKQSSMPLSLILTFHFKS